MKKLILSAIIMLGSISTFAIPVEKTMEMCSNIQIQDEFTEINVDALPDAVKTTIKGSFPNAKLVKAYTNEKKEYKLEIAVGDKNFTVFTDANGNIVKK